MKIRNGFVSNSSSSSFILGFKSRPKTDRDVFDALFPGLPLDSRVLGPCDEDLMAAEVASMVFDDIVKERGIVIKNVKELAKHCVSGYFEGYPDYNYYSDSPSTIYARQFTAKHKKDIFNCSDTHPEEVEEWQELMRRESEQREKQCLRAATEYAKRIWPTFKGCEFIVSLEYGDSHGIRHSATLEHGTAWDMIPHITISHH